MLAIWTLVIAAQVQINAPDGCDVGSLTRVGLRDDVTVTASISANGAFHGTIEIATEDRTYPARTVVAERCEQAAEALALIAEMAIDRLPKRSPPLHPAAAIAPGVALRTAIHPLRLEEWHVSAGVHGVASFGRAPSWRPSALPFIELARDPIALRAAFLWSYDARADLRVTHLAARVEACPFHWVAADFELDPCASLELGAIRGESMEARTAFWLAPGLVARGRWRFAHPLFAELELGASVPVLRPRFLLEPEETLWHAPAFAFSAGAGLGATIW